MPKRAVLLVNLGSPDSTAVADVRRYLREFLGDERVIDRPSQPFRWLLVNGIITPFRAPKSTHASNTGKLAQILGPRSAKTLRNSIAVSR